MLRKTLRIFFVLAVVAAAVWVYLKMVAEPLVRDINHYKRESRELRDQRTRLEQSRVDVAKMKTAEHGRLSGSRRMLRTRMVVPGDSVPLHVKSVLVALRSRARFLGLRMHKLEESPFNDKQRARVDLPITGTRMHLISIRIQGPSREWGRFLEAASHLPAYLTLSSVQGNSGPNAQMRVEWILHHIPGNEPLPRVRPSLVNSASSLLDRPIPTLKPGRLPGVGGR
ncbi:MAG: hypothetical protein JXA62_02330 [Candidatus Aminicenantes bacterium]|nr:hypothetical protein [Candidatus Aminicenantes bacterium]